MSRSKRHSTGTTTHPDSALNDQHHLLSDPYPTPSTSPSLPPTRHHNHPPLSPLSYSTSTTSSTTANTSSSSYHTIAGAAAAHLIKQKQQLQQQQQQAIHDNARTLPAKVRGSSTTTATAIFNIPAPPRKSGGSRIGQSILGQLLAAHSPGGRSNSGGGGSELSSETHRPKEQQRRSVFPASWGLNFTSSSKSRAVQYGGPSLPSKHSTTTTASSTAAAPTTGVTGSAVPLGGPLLPSQLMENPEPMDRLQPVLPSVWLESILSGLSRADLNIPPHYATLPRVNWQDEQQQQPPIFPGLGPRLKKEDRPSSSKNTRFPSSAAVAGTTSPPHPPSSTSTLDPRAQQTLHKKSSVCELALGDDARELFQQNRPKTLSSAVIQSQIVPLKESLRNNVRQRSLDSSTTLALSSGAIHKPVSESSPNHRASSGSVIIVHTPSPSSEATPATVKTTRGRFTIESQSALPSPARTRTLSCTSVTALDYGESSSYSTSLTPPSILSSGGPQDRGMSPRRMDRTASFSIPPSSPTLSRSFPSSRSLHSPSFPPSPRLSPLSVDLTNSNSDSSNSINTTSSPISIPSRASSPASSPSGRSSHQRSQSSTSSMSSSRFSQVVIPPPASAASLQFASFSSIGSPSRSSVPSASLPTEESSSWAASGTSDSLVTEKRPNNSNGSNNIRNLSIQIVEADRTSRNSSRASRRTLEYEGEPTPVHPLDEDLAASASTTPASTIGAVAREDGLIRTHQTMNRVHPNLDHDFVDSPAGSEGSSSLGSRVGSISGGGGSGTFIGSPDRRASDNAHQKHYESGGIGYFDRTSPGSFRPRSLSATNLDSVGTNNGSTPSLHQQLSWADRTAMQREGSSSSRFFDTGTPPASSSSLSPHSHGGELSDVVMVKKSAKGRMFTVERQSTLPPASPTRSSRFIVVSSTEDMCLSTPSSLSPHPHVLH
ncbi:MAG: hypothetical protein JOS17DRAFT_758136 [Linnemannia elongata]|nr:MAG: hypothetical protein JOS17DRAFT_758136 [Linnemannia elongata]